MIKQIIFITLFICKYGIAMRNKIFFLLEVGQIHELDGQFEYLNGTIETRHGPVRGYKCV